MADGYEVGSAFLQIVPSFRGVIRAITDEAAKWGVDAGETFAKSFNEVVGANTNSPFGPSDSESAKRGGSTGGAFADAFKARVAAAFRSLPAATVELEDKAAQAKLEEIRAQLISLSQANVGVDLTDKEALAKIAQLRKDLAELGAKSPSIRVQVDSAAAIAQLEAVGIAADTASGSGGIGGFFGLGESAGGAGSALGGVLGTVGLLATALIPLGAVVGGVALGFTGLAVAATAGIGAFAFAALPTLTKVTAAYQQINTDQAALMRATTTAQKNTALTHLQDDLNGLSPVVGTLTLGLIKAKQILTDWSAQFDSTVIKVFTSALNDLKPALTAITPLAKAGGEALAGVFKTIGQQVNAPDFKKFVSWLSTQVGPAVAALQTAFDNFAGGFSKMLQNSSPLIDLVERGLVSISQKFEDFAGSSTFRKFVDYVIANGPLVGSAIEAIVTAVGHIVVGFAPIGTTVLSSLAGLASAISSFPSGAVTAIGLAFGAWVLWATPLSSAMVILAASLVAVGLAVHGLQPLGVVKQLTDAQIKGAAAATGGKGTWSDKIDLANARQRGITDAQLKTAAAGLNRPVDPNFQGPLLPGETPPRLPPTPHQREVIKDVKNNNTTQDNVAQRDLVPIWQRGNHGFETTIASPLAGAVRTAWHDASHELDNVVGGVSAWLTKSLPHAVSRGWHGIQTTLFSPLAGAIRTGWHDAAHELDNISGGISDWFTNTIPHALDHVRSFFHQAWADAANAVHVAWSWMVNTVFDPLRNFFENSIPNALDHVRSFFHQAWSDISNAVTGAWNWMRDNVFSPIGDALNTVGSAASAVQTAFDDAFSALGGIIQRAWDDMAPVINAIIDGVNLVISAMNLIPGVNIPKVPHVGEGPGPTAIGAGQRIDHRGIAGNAAGTGMGTFEGMTWVGERGPEIANFGKPVQIIPHDATIGTGSTPARTGHGVNIEHAEFRNEADLEVLTRKANHKFMAGVL